MGTCFYKVGMVIFKEEWENLDGGGGEGRGVSQDQLFRVNAVNVNVI